MAATDEQLLLVRLEATATKLVSEMKRAAAVTKTTTDGMGRDAANANRRVTDGLARQGRAFREASQSAGQMRSQVQNTAFQFQDFAVQVAGGTDASRALAQQLPQLLGGLGVFGAVAGAAAAVAIPLAASLFGAADGAEELSKKVETLQGAIKTLRSASEASNASMFDLSVSYGVNAEEAQRVLEIQREIASIRADRAFGEASRSAAAAIGGDIVGFSADQLRANAALLTKAKADYDELNRKIADFGDITSEAAAKEFEALQARRAQNDLAFRSLLEYRNALETISDAFNVSEDAAAALAVQIGLINQADTSQERLEAARGLAEAIFQQTNELKNADENAEALYQSLLDAVIAGLDLEALEIANTIGAGADEAGRLAENLEWASRAQAQFDSKYRQVGTARADPRQFTNDSNTFGGDTYTPPTAGTESARSASPVDQRAKTLELGAKEIAQLQLQMALLGQTAEHTAYLTAQNQMLTAAKQAGLDLDAVNAETGKTLRAEIDAQAAAIGRLTVEYQAAAEKQQFFKGITEDLQNGLVDAIVAGQGFAGVMANIAQQIAKAALQAALFGKGPLTSLFGGTAGVGLLTGFAEGGYTGSGGKYEPAGVVHKGEYVFDAATVKKLGLRNLEAIRQGAKGYANGGYVGSPNVSVSPAPVSVVVIDNEDKFGDFLARNPRAEREVIRIVNRNGNR